MNYLSVSLFIASAIFVQSYECAKVEPQVKVVDTDTWYYNKEYVNALKYIVTKGNATYNHITLHWDLKKDLPADLKLVSKVYVTDSSYKTGHLLLIDDTPVCVKSDHYELLPKVLIVDESLLNGKCIKKGVYDMEDMGQLRFEQLIPDLHKEGNYYKVDYRLGTDTEIVLIVTFYTEWGYLKDY
ncbi:uncharacterized protein LOC100113497 [Nasonia vitripennis]|uniref:Uncharacterized protein n=1 Tax=Nasonia vitripennis TaxID=7425 RepID=A0A7M7G1C4_NASVI|nr:uncharacterized protein LOC100113497 [Nasonia vitripennis]